VVPNAAHHAPARLVDCNWQAAGRGSRACTC